MNADFHTHSNASDGKLSPAGLLEAAVARGVEALAITDHDTCQGYRSIAHLSFGALRLVSGIELSARWGKLTVHVVGLGIDAHSRAMRGIESRQRAERIARARRIARRLSHLGVPQLFERSAELAGEGTLGRPHIAQALAAAGAVRDASTAFRKYLGQGKAGDVCAQWPELGTVVNWVRDTGGIAILAHPAKYRLTNTRLAELLGDFTRCGGRGMEVVCGHQDPAVTAKLAQFCARFELLASCGSDFHAHGRPWSELGRVSGLPAGLEPVSDLI